MRVVVLPLLAALSAIPVVALAGDSTAPSSHAASADHASAALSLEQAFQLAEQANPELRRALAQRAAVEGDAADARGLLWNNPEVSYERTRRNVPSAGLPAETQREWSAGLSQTFEIAGQQGYRRRATRQELAAFEASIDEARLQLRADVERRFVQVLSLQERVNTEQQSLELIESTARSIGRRVAAGEDSRLDGNLATVEAVRARNQIGVVTEQLIQARQELAAALQLPPGELPLVTGALAVNAPPYTLDVLQASAAKRPLLRTLNHREQAAQARLSLERAARYPDVTVGVSTAREGPLDARERIARVTVSVPLPLFRRNRSGIGRAATELTQAQVERQAAERDANASVNALWQRLQSLTSRVTALQQTVLPALEENQRLSAKSLQAGEIGLTQLLLVNRQVLDGQRDLIDAQTELRITRIELQLAAGWSAATNAPAMVP
jgi:cobalt-zinc-cadmium efflux system outer membrane protein